MSLAEPGVRVAARVTGSPTLAGASMAAAGSTVPSGRVWEPSGSALAEPTPTPARLAVQAAESTASGTIVIARWIRPKLAMSVISPGSSGCHDAPSGPHPHLVNDEFLLHVTHGSLVGQGTRGHPGPPPVGCCLSTCVTMRR